MAGNKNSGGWESVHCVEAVGRGPRGYRRSTLNGRRDLAHRNAWVAATGEPIPEGMLVLHCCDNRACAQAEGRGVYVVDGVEYERRGHLWLGPPAANSRDMVLKGRSLSGHRHPSARLSSEERSRHFATIARSPNAHHFSHEQAVRCGRLGGEAKARNLRGVTSGRQ